MPFDIEDVRCDLTFALAHIQEAAVKINRADLPEWSEDIHELAGQVIAFRNQFDLAFRA